MCAVIVLQQCINLQRDLQSYVTHIEREKAKKSVRDAAAGKTLVTETAWRNN